MLPDFLPFVSFPLAVTAYGVRNHATRSLSGVEATGTSLLAVDGNESNYFQRVQLS